ncbi:MAG: BLUF domain-containing protein [Janthinobacterium lividum]
MSKAVKLMTDKDLLPLLEESRNWNIGHGLTGMLLYVEGQFLERKEGKFMQVLEGSEFEVRAIFEKIKSDNRHRNIILLNEKAIEKRNFKTWLMGFESLKLEDYTKIPDFFELNIDFLKNGNLQNFNNSLNFLKSFYILHSTTKS